MSDEKTTVLQAMRVAEAYCYDAGAANAARNMKDAREALVELILAADRVARRVKRLTSVDAPGSAGDAEVDALIAALDRVGGAA